MISHPYADLEPAEVWKHFAALNAIPRPSGQEEAARQYIQRIAGEHGATSQSDARGNIVVRVPASAPHQSTLVALQSHLDMVCEKRPDVEHDFERDGIVPRRDGDWIFGSGTTLGADNGLGCAMMLAALTTPDLAHGPLELLFTVEEETGLHGAAQLDPNLISAPMLLNLDSEDPNEIIIGCAGGRGATLQIPLETEAPDQSTLVAHEIVVSGLKGGHSGVQIHEPLANAIKVLSGVLGQLQERGCEFRLAHVGGGRAHNAIPRDTAATIVFPTEHQDAFDAAVLFAAAAAVTLWEENEPGIGVDTQSVALPSRIFAASTHDTTLQLLQELPHGVLAMSERFVGKVQTSANLASVEVTANAVEMHVSIRSFVESELSRVQGEVSELAQTLNVGVEMRDGYPGWEPSNDSQLREIAREVFVQVNHREPVVEVIHAGLECGLIAAKRPGLDAISFGPLIRGAHTPEEGVLHPDRSQQLDLASRITGAPGVGIWSSRANNRNRHKATQSVLSDAIKVLRRGLMSENATEKATFGAGCFWGVEAAFRRLPGVLATAVGYAGGHKENPTYKEVCTDRTGHAEVVQVEFDPNQISYDDLLQVFWENHDPTQLNRQGPDFGSQYRSAIFYHSDAQKEAAEKSKAALDNSDRYIRPVVTQIEAAPTFYFAEDYHQQYLEKRGMASCHI